MSCDRSDAWLWQPTSIPCDVPQVWKQKQTGETVYAIFNGNWIGDDDIDVLYPDGTRTGERIDIENGNRGPIHNFGEDVAPFLFGIPIVGPAVGAVVGSESRDTFPVEPNPGVPPAGAPGADLYHAKSGADSALPILALVALGGVAWFAMRK